MAVLRTDYTTADSREEHVDVHNELSTGHNLDETHRARTDNPHAVTKSQVGLGNADNTADAAKPVSTAQQTALDAKQAIDADLTAIAALDSATAGALATDGAGWIRKTYAQLKTALALVKADVGLGNVDNTADAAKPVSTATQSALDAKQASDADLTTIAALDSATAGALVTDGAGWIRKTYAQLKAALSLTAGDIAVIPGGGLAADDVQEALSELDTEKQAADADLTTIAALDSATAGALVTDGAGWIRKTYAQLKTALSLVKGDVGLGNVDNTSDAAKPISTATQAALDAKASLAVVGCKVTRGSAQTIANSTVTVVAFTSEEWDSDGFHDNATNNSRMTVPAGHSGKYTVSATVVFTANATGRRVVRLFKNGTTIVGRTDSNAVSVAGVITTLNVTAEVSMSPTDYIEVQVFQDSGGNLDLATANLADSAGTTISGFGTLRKVGT